MKYYRTKLTLEVLSAERIPDGTPLTAILNECETGDYVAAGVETSEEELTRRAMDVALEEAGSDAEFFAEIA